MNKFTFSNKEEYLAYRVSWKNEYKELSKTLHESKYMRKEEQRAYDRVYKRIGDPYAIVGKWNTFFKEVDLILLENQDYKKLREKHGKISWGGGSGKCATKMLLELKLAKEESRRLYLESRKNKE